MMCQPHLLPKGQKCPVGCVSASAPPMAVQVPGYRPQAPRTQACTCTQTCLLSSSLSSAYSSSITLYLSSALQRSMD